MNDPTYTLAPEAVDDLDEIASFIARRDGHLRADTVLSRMDHALLSLAFRPNAGRRAFANASLPRRYPIPPWIVLFVPSNEGIEILRIYDGRRDLKRLLREHRPAHKPGDRK